MYVAAKTQAAQQSPTQPVIVPNDPPEFNNCIALVEEGFLDLAKTSTKTLRGECQQAFTSLKNSVLDFLIKAYWYQADADKLGIKVTNAQVEKTFTAEKNAQFASNPAGFNTFLSQSGQTVPDLLYRFRDQRDPAEARRQAHQAVTQAQIQAYYNSHLSQFGTQETRSMKVVLASSQANALAAKKALSSGQSWATVVKKYSIDPTTKSTGGVLNGVTKQQEEAALSTAAFAAPANKLLGPVKGQFGWYVFEVTKIIPGTQQTLAQASSQIKQQLTSRRRRPRRPRSTIRPRRTGSARRRAVPRTRWPTARATRRRSRQRPPPRARTATTG